MAAFVVHPCGNSAVEIVHKYCKPPENVISINRKTSDKNSKDPFIVLNDGTVVRGLLTTIKALVRFSEKDRVLESSLMGDDPLEKAEVEQWLEHCLTQVGPWVNERTEMKDILRLLNSYLEDRVYFIGQHLTVADLLLFSTLYDLFNSLTFQDKEKNIHVSRWFQEVQNQPTIVNHCKKVKFLRNLIY